MYSLALLPEERSVTTVEIRTTRTWLSSISLLESQISSGIVLLVTRCEYDH